MTAGTGILDEATAAFRSLSLDTTRHVSLVTGQATAEPAKAVRAALVDLQSAHRRTGTPESTRIYRGMSINPPETIPDGAGIRVVSSGMLGTNRPIWERGQLDIIPEGVSRIPRLMREGVIGNDALLVRVTRTGDGRFSTGIMNDYLPAAVESAACVLVEVCDEMPVLDGAVVIDAERVDAVIEHGGPLPEVAAAAAQEADREIAKHVASLVQDGDCIQIGVGGLGHAVARQLAETRRDLGIHTGLLNDDVLALIDSGAVTNRRKTIDPGVSVAPVVMGTADLYRRLRGRTDIVLRSVEHTNDPGVIAQIDRVAAINSVVQVDLLGQLNAEAVGGRRISSVGGQLEFSTGASRSAGGKVIAMTRSTARGGTLSSIVPRLPEATVTVGASLVDYVVTEYGTAHLRGATLEERARRLVSIAHPNFRAALLEALEADGRIVPRSIE